MHHAGLHRRVGPGRPDRGRQSFESVAAHDQRVGQAPVAQLGQHGRPLLGALAAGGAQPQAQHVAFALKIHADGHIHGPVGDLGVADLDHDRVDQQHRVDRVEGPVLPHRHVGHDLVGDLRDRLPAHRGVIDLFEMRLDLTGREPLRVQRDHIARQPVEAAPMLGHRHRLEGPRTVTGHPQIDLADLGGHPLGGRPIARVRGPAAFRGVTLIAQMLSHLDLETGLEHLAHQPRQQAAVAGQLHALGACLGHQPLGPVLHRCLVGSLARRHSRHVMISHRHDPSQPTALSCGPSDHARYTNFLTGPQ